MADLSPERERVPRDELHVSAHPSAQFRVRARQGRAGLGLRNFRKNKHNGVQPDASF